MCNKMFSFLFSFLVSFVCFAQVYNGELYDQNAHLERQSQNTLADNFTEFAPVYSAFLAQNRKWIANGQYKQARESLTPFIDQFRARLGFKSKARVEFGLKNFDEQDIAITHKEMLGAYIKELSITNMSSSMREKLTAAIQSSLPDRYLESLFLYKRVLLMHLTAILGEHASYSGGDKQTFSRNIFDDFLFLIAPAIRFDTAEAHRYLVIYEYELNMSSEQAAFESDLFEFVRTYSSYFSFLATPEVRASIEPDYKRFRTFQQNAIRRSMQIKAQRKPANEPDAEQEKAEPRQEQPVSVDVQEPDVTPRPIVEQRRNYSKPTAVLSQNAKGALQFDLDSLTEIADSDVPVENMVQDLKIYLTSSAMTWGQNQIQFNSSFTHSNSQIKVFVKSFPLSDKFVSAMTEVYYAELYNFFLFGKEALVKKNTLENRNEVYNCLVKMSLAPVAINCDGVLAITSMYDENNRKKFMDAYMRLLRMSRITFEFSTDSVNTMPETQTTCGRIRALQKELINSYKSPTNSYLPSLISIQGPSFKSSLTGKREYLCQGSLNPFLQ